MRYIEPKFGYDDNNKKTLEFSHYIVEEKSKNYTAIYKNGVLITSKVTFKSASKVAKLLEQAYIDGYNDGADDYTD